MAIFVAAFAYGAPAIADTDSLRATASSDEGAAPGERELLGRLVDAATAARQMVGA